MSGVFLDSNVILYLLSADAVKADAAEKLIAQQPTISVQVLNEVTSISQRKLKLSWSEILNLLNAIKANCKVVPLTLDTHTKALEVAQQHMIWPQHFHGDPDENAGARAPELTAATNNSTHLATS
jgi:predicted nucleic acid-binding protein